MRFFQLEIDLWPAALALMSACSLIGLLFVVDRVASVAAHVRTQRALRRILSASAAE